MDNHASEAAIWVTTPLGSAAGAAVGGWLGLREPEGGFGWMVLGGC